MMRKPVLILTVLLSLACAVLNPTTPEAPLATEPPPAVSTIPAATEAPAATSIPTPLPEATEAPMVSLNSEGPWLIIDAATGIWAANGDGTGLTNVLKQRIISPVNNVKAALSPHGGLMAFVTVENEVTYQWLELQVLSFPAGKPKSLISLFPSDVVPFTGDNFGSDSFEAARSIADYDSLAWSPDGTKLAFLGAQEGPSSDVYVYRPSDESVSRLTDGPSQAYGLSWSLDGVYIVHTGISTFGTGAGYGVVGMWAVPADGLGLKTLTTPDAGDVKVLGWIASNVFVMHEWAPDCGNKNLRYYNLNDDTGRYIAPGCFSSAVFDQATQALAFITLPDPAGGIRTGLHIVPPESTEPLFIRGDAKSVKWSPRFGQFHVLLNDGSLAAYSPGSAEVPYLTEEIIGLPEGVSVDEAVWSPDNNHLAVRAGDTVYTVDVTTMVATPLVGGADGLTINSFAWLTP